MQKFLLILLLTISLNPQPLFSQNNKFETSVSTAFNSKNTLGFYNNLRTQNRSNINLSLRYLNDKLSSQLSLNFDDHNKLSFDNSHINYYNRIANFNIGKIDRMWSFSKKSSLVLSSNSRPLDAISIILKNKFDTQWLSPMADWSVELINGTTKNSLNGKNSMFSGARVIISPSEKLNFEFIQTSQWGDHNDKLYTSNIDAFLFGDTNTGKNANINKMAGFGLSYLKTLQNNTYRFYSQTIGEDEAGSLPSCLAWMAGIEFNAPEIKFPTTISIEAVDTRVKKSTHGFCGPNTMYNNGVYNYVNYKTVLGVPIDTESSSLELFGRSQINKNLDINYSTKFLSINDKDYSQHRLASKRSLGLISSIGISWKKNTLNIDGNIRYQDLTLDKIDVNKGIVFSLTSSVNF